MAVYDVFFIGRIRGYVPRVWWVEGVMMRALGKVYMSFTSDCMSIRASLVWRAADQHCILVRA